MGQTHRFYLRLAALALPLASAYPAGLLQDGGDEMSDRWYDLRGIVRASGAALAPVDMRLPLSATDLSRLEVPRAPEQHPIFALDESTIADFVEHAILRAPGAQVELRRNFAGKLLLTADGEGHRIAQSIVRSATEWSQAGASVEVFEVPAGALAPGIGSVVTGAAADALFTSGAATSLGQGFFPFGENGVLGEEAATSYVQDYDVEVASGAVAADLCVSVLRTGARLGLRAELTRDRKQVVLRAFGRRSSLEGPMRTVTLPAFAKSDLEMPALDVALFSCSAKLGIGDAMIMHAGDPKAPAIVARVTQLVVPGAESAANALLFGDMFLGDRRRDPIAIPLAEPSQGFPRSDENLAGISAPWSVNELPIAVDARDFVNEILDEPAASSAILSLGNVGIFAGEASKLAQLRGQIAALSEGLGRPTIGIEVAYQAMDVGAKIELANATDYARFAAADGTRRLRGACCEGDTLQLVGGRNAAYLQDHDCQIAGGSSIMDPIIRHTFEGFSFWCSPIVAEGGPVSAWVDLKFIEPGPAPRTATAARFSYPLSSTKERQPRAVGKFFLDLPIELPETHQASLRGNLPSISHEWSFLAAESIAGTDKRFVAVIRATVR